MLSEATSESIQSRPEVAAVSRRDRILISICLVLVTALAWAYLIHLDRQMSSSMEHDTMMAEMGMAMDMRWTATDVWFTFAMWAVMMIGMMTPSAAPLLLLYAGARTARGEPSAMFAILMFAAGYLTVWVAFSAVAALTQWRLHDAAMLSPAMAAASSRVAGAILIAAGVYQVTPLKGVCLTHCRSPLGFLMSHWRNGLTGALEMGLRHGAYCLGCCWALMCVLFAVGVMNLAWVAALTAFVLIEKIGPRGALVARAGGIAMIAFGVSVIAGAV